MAPQPQVTTTGSAGQSSAADAGQVVAGILWVYPEERFLAFTTGSIVIGRADDAGAVLSCDQVSRQHAVVQRKGAKVVLRDMSSRNGTFVNAVRSTEVALVLGHVVRIGDWVGIVTEVAAADYSASNYFEEPEPHVVAGPSSRSVWATVQKLSPTSQSLLIEGSTGTGKEVVARAIHRQSGRRGAFVGVNCAALPESLVEAQLFGHSRGSFTGATQASAGLIGAADGGTLLLDEVADLPLLQQARLLRVIEERAVLRVGESSPRPIDVRFLAACQLSLWRLSQEGKFRADLLGRLAGGSIRLPALRERREEIPRIFRAQFVAAGGEPARLKSTAIEALCLASWPLNVRQLVQVARLSATLGQDLPAIGASVVQNALRDVCADMPEADADAPAGPAAAPVVAAPVVATPAVAARANGSKAKPIGRRARWLSRHQQELAELQRAMAQCSGNVSEAARSIDLPRWRAVRLLQVLEEGAEAQPGE